VAGTDYPAQCWDGGNRIYSHDKWGADVPDTEPWTVNPDFDPNAPYALPQTPPMTPLEARQHCLDHAGAWPEARCEGDQMILDLVQEKTLAIMTDTRDDDYTPVPASAEIAPDVPGAPQLAADKPHTEPLTASEAPATLGNDPDTPELTKLEKWLLDQHVEDGRSITHVWYAPECVTR